jgi:2-keto-3-deoxy-L-rhamnonate aldolase RhmA
MLRTITASHAATAKLIRTPTPANWSLTQVFDLGQRRSLIPVSAIYSRYNKVAVE